MMQMLYIVTFKCVLHEYTVFDEMITCILMTSSKNIFISEPKLCIHSAWGIKETENRNFDVIVLQGVQHCKQEKRAHTRRLAVCVFGLGLNLRLGM